MLHEEVPPEWRKTYTIKSAAPRARHLVSSRAVASLRAGNRAAAVSRFDSERTVEPKIRRRQSGEDSNDEYRSRHDSEDTK